MLTLSGFIILVSLINAQDYEFGLKIGSGLSSDQSSIVNFDPILGNRVSILYQITVLNKIKIRSEAGYLKKGYFDEIILNNDLGEPIGSAEGKIIYHKIFFGPGLYFNIINTNKISPYVGVQFNMEYLIKGTNSDFDNLKNLEDIYTDWIDDQKNLSYSGILDIGVEFISLFFVEGTVSYGLDKMPGNVKANELYIGGSVGIYLNKLF